MPLGDVLNTLSSHFVPRYSRFSMHFGPVGASDKQTASGIFLAYKHISPNRLTLFPDRLLNSLGLSGALTAIGWP